MAKKIQEHIDNDQSAEAVSDFSYTQMLAQFLGGVTDVSALTNNIIGERPSLVRRDLLQYEDVLCRDLAHFIKFEAYALYFPTQDEMPNAHYLENEKKLLLPLRCNDALLGVLLLRNVSVEKRLVPFLPALAQICLEKIYHVKLGGLDERCNLMRSQQFMARVFREVYGITQFYAQSFARSAVYSAVTATTGPASDQFFSSALASPVSSRTVFGASADDDKNVPDKKTSGEKKSLITENINIFNGFSNDIYSESSGASHAGQTDRQSSVGLMVLSVLGLDYVRKFYGFAVAEQLFISLSQKIRELIPEDALCTMLDGDRFALLFSGATRRMLENLARQCAVIEESMQAVPVVSMLAAMENLGDIVEAKLCAGYALFPQDWDGTADSRDSSEIPHLLLQKACIAAGRLKNMPNRKGVSAENEAFHTAGNSLAFRQILLQGGNIQSILPYSQVRVNLGSEDGAQESMCFSVWGDAEHIRYKGEILLRKIDERTSEAEILMLSDPAKSLEEGDFLQYVPQSRSQSEVLNAEGDLFYAYRDFMTVVNGQMSAENVTKFSLALMRIQWEKRPNINEQSSKLDENSTSEKLASAKKTEKIVKKGKKSEKSVRKDFTMKEIAQELDVCLKEYNEKNNRELLKPVIGSMSFNSLLIYHPQMDGQSVKVLYEKLGAMIEKKFDVPCATGIAAYPFLRFRPADMWDACRKALDYAMLLPIPHVGIFDSLAINISADRKFSQGDIFGAVEEYRMALLADDDNILAWNSLGICLAELGRHAEARSAFEVAHARQNKDASTCYNLGAANLALEDREKAKEFFLACLAQDNNHLFARIRLGEIAEKEQKHEEAFEQYTKASLDNPESSVPYRCLAKLYTLRNEKERARELLQLALQKNSEDAVSLQFLAGLYLDGGEDAELAEVLARQSVALLPWRRSAWAELARALEAQGRFSEAAEVRRNSMRL